MEIFNADTSNKKRVFLQLFTPIGVQLVSCGGARILQYTPESGSTHKSTVKSSALASVVPNQGAYIVNSEYITPIPRGHVHDHLQVIVQNHARHTYNQMRCE